MMKSYVLIDIGGTAIKYGLLDEEERLFFKDKISTETWKGGIHIQQTVIRLVSELLHRCQENHTQAVGIAISSAGMVNVKEGYIFHAGPTIPNFKGTQFRKPLEETFGIPCEIENDVNCAGLAEYKAGAGKETDSMVCLTIGTGIGGCAVIDGKILHGFTGSACEVGYMHMSGLSNPDSSAIGSDSPYVYRDSFERIGSASALSRRVSELKNEKAEDWDGVHIFSAAESGDRECRRAINEMCDVLGKGIANICYVLNPEMVVLGGGIMAQKEILYPMIRTAMNRYLVPVIAENTRLEMAQMGNDAGMIGAYYHFRQMQDMRKR